jgi:hypothetical protein
MVVENQRKIVAEGPTPDVALPWAKYQTSRIRKAPGLT